MWVEKISHFLALSVNISKKVADTAKLLLMTNRKSHMSFRLAPRSRDFSILGGNNGYANEDSECLIVTAR